MYNRNIPHLIFEFKRKYNSVIITCLYLNDLIILPIVNESSWIQTIELLTNKTLAFINYPLYGIFSILLRDRALILIHVCITLINPLVYGCWSLKDWNNQEASILNLPIGSQISQWIAPRMPKMAWCLIHCCRI